MIDWLKFRIPWMPPRFDTTQIVVIEPDGTVSWQKFKPLEVRGSWETSLHVTACPVSGRLLVDGNPVKFFQGHNLWGCDDPRPIITHTLVYLRERLGLQIPDETIQLNGEFELSRIDITQMFDFLTIRRVRDALRSIHARARLRHRPGQASTKEATVYMGQHSRRWGVKFYSKWDEITAPKHKLAGGLLNRDDLFSYSAPALRVEFVLRAMELKARELHLLANWYSTTAADLYAELLNKLELPSMIELTGAALEGLSPRLQLAYDAWKAGKDLRALLPDRTFYRYRLELMKHGIDISLKQDPAPVSNVIPLVQILRGTPMGIPEWAIDTELVWKPSLRA